MAKVMIESAVNGVLMRDRNPHVPYSPAEIAADAVAVCRAGAALVHYHVRNPDTGEWIEDLDAYAEVIRRIRAECNPLIWPTYPAGDDPAERVAHFRALSRDPATRPDLGAADPGSVNQVSYDPVSRTFTSDDVVYQNSFATSRHFLETCRELGLRPTLQIFDPSFLRAVLVFLEMGLLSEPLLIKFYLGGPTAPFGLPPTLKSLEAYLAMLEGVRCHWFAATLGGDNLPFVPQIVSLGGHVRVGLEDHAYTEEGKLSNVQLVERAAAIIADMGAEVASPDEARQMLEVRDAREVDRE